MKNLKLLLDVRNNYNQSLFQLPENIRKKFPFFTPEGLEAEKEKAKEKILKEYREKISNIKSIIKSDKTKAQKEYYGLKYPDRLSNISVYREVGIKQKTNALLFLSLNPSDAGILQEIRQAFELDDIDYASNLIDVVKTKFDLYTREQLQNLTQAEATSNIDKVNRSNKYLTNPEEFPLLNAVTKIEQEHFPKLKEYETELKDYEVEESILNDFQSQIDGGADFIRSADLFPFLNEQERLDAFNFQSKNNLEEISFRRKAAQIWKQSNPSV
ncbi:MAG: hypothetical protein QME58_13715 [Bacteroidota bacterium]|nr:hypothetical protein [Bacteroidota bacterium]